MFPLRACKNDVWRNTSTLVPPTFRSVSLPGTKTEGGCRAQLGTPASHRTDHIRPDSVPGQRVRVPSKLERGNKAPPGCRSTPARHPNTPTTSKTRHGQLILLCTWILVVILCRFRINDSIAFWHLSPLHSLLILRSSVFVSSKLNCATACLHCLLRQQGQGCSPRLGQGTSRRHIRLGNCSWVE